MIRQFPHCDARILHAPGECEYCDLHPEWQELRKMWGIAFTGHLPGPITAADVEGQGGSRSYAISWRTPATRPEVWLPCPADFARPAGSTSDHRRWYGNRVEVELEVALPPLRPAPTRPDPGLTEKIGGTPPSGSRGQSFWARVFPWPWR